MFFKGFSFQVSLCSDILIRDRYSSATDLFPKPLVPFICRHPFGVPCQLFASEERTLQPQCNLVGYIKKIGRLGRYCKLLCRLRELSVAFQKINNSLSQEKARPARHFHRRAYPTLGIVGSGSRRARRSWGLKNLCP